MPPADQHLLQETIAQALCHLGDAIQEEAAGSRRWVRLVKVLEAVETLDRLADPLRDVAPARAALSPPAPAMRAQRLALANLLSGGSASELRTAA